MSRKDAITLANRDLLQAREALEKSERKLDGRGVFDPSPEQSAASAVRYLRAAIKRIERAFNLEEVGVG